MDIFAHMAWTNVVFYKKYKAEIKNRLIAVFFGVLPDFLSFTPVFLFSFLTRTSFVQLATGAVQSRWIEYASESYNYTHSIVFFALLFGVVCLVRKMWGKKEIVYWPLFGWLLHIVIDIFTHKGFYETPFLFPLSGFKFSHGISWGHPVFMMINYGALALVYIVWFFVLRKKELQKPKDPRSCDIM